MVKYFDVDLIFVANQEPDKVLTSYQLEVYEGIGLNMVFNPQALEYDMTSAFTKRLSFMMRNLREKLGKSKFRIERIFACFECELKNINDVKKIFLSISDYEKKRTKRGFTTILSGKKPLVLEIDKRIFTDQKINNIYNEIPILAQRVKDSWSRHS